MKEFPDSSAKLKKEEVMRVARAKIIDGEKIAEGIQDELKQRVKELKNRGITPRLATILVGEDPASLSYLRRIKRSFEAVDIPTEDFKLPEDITQKELEKKIGEVNQDPRLHGILLLVPLPKHIDLNKTSEMIDPKKDIDCLNPVNVGLFLLGNPRFVPCTPLAVYEILRRSGYDPRDKNVVVAGAGRIGTSLAPLLLSKWAIVTACHARARDLAKYTRNAEILISTAGKPHLITADMVRERAVVVDVGVSMVENPERPGKSMLVGDVDFDAVKDKAEAITPVRGGVGPVTTVMLISNTIKASEMMEGL